MALTPLEVAKRDIQIRQLQRKEKLAEWNAYISFVVSKLAGVAGVVLGILGMYDPQRFHFSRPGTMLGAGLALLAGKSILTLVAKFLSQEWAG
jgi:hypothetical protein